jgi:hypothetical protein
MPRVSPAVAGNLVVQTAGGAVVDAGFAADVNATGGSVVRRDSGGTILAADDRLGLELIRAQNDSGVAIVAKGATPIQIKDGNDEAVSEFSTNGVLEFVGLSAEANRLAQANEIRGVSYGAAQSLTSGQQAQAQANLGAGVTGAAVFASTTGAAALVAIETVVTATVSANYAIDGNTGSVFNLTLTGNYTISFTNMAAGRVVTVNLIQDGTGNRTVTWSGVAWGSEGEPTLSTGAGDRDKLVFSSFDGTNIDGHLINQYT